MIEGPFSSLAPEQWPEQDRQLWFLARSAGDLWEDEGLAASWRPATVRTVEYGYGIFLWWLSMMGRLDPLAGIPSRVSQTNIRDFAQNCSSGRTGRTVSSYLSSIGEMLRVTCPNTKAPWIKRIATQSQRRAQPAKPIAQRKCPVADLIKLGDDLMTQGRALMLGEPHAGAIMFRNGLMIIMETQIPMRRANFAGLRIGHNMWRHHGRYHVEIDGSYMKNGRDYQCQFSTSLTAEIDFYINDVRPILRAGLSCPDEGAFWIGRRGESMKGEALSVRVRELTRKHLGIPLALHSFRHSVATDIALLVPENVGIIKSVLGHSSPLSAQHYNLASGFDAANKYQAMLDNLRKQDRQRGS